MIVTTGSWGWVYGPAGEVASWDTESPHEGPALPGERLILDGMEATWAIDVIPPVAQPSTLRFRVYMAEPDAGGNWLNVGIGDPIAASGFAYRDSLDDAELFVMRGRVADLSAVNARGGGLIFTFIVADRLADLGSANAPALIDGSGVYDGDTSHYSLFRVYDAIADDAGITFDYDLGRVVGTPFPYWDRMNAAIDLTNVTVLDALSTAVAHDVRADNVAFDHTLDHWLTLAVDDPYSVDPQASIVYATNEWDYTDVNGLAGALGLHWTGSVWTVLANPDYYVDGGAGMVLDASQVARDVGEWRQTRDQAINTVEGTSPTTFDDGTQTKRATHPDLVDRFGRNTRSVPDWWHDADDARAYLYEILLVRSQVQAEGFGFSALTIAWETLSEDQLDAWATKLFPRMGVTPLGRAFTLVNVPDDWRLIDGPAVTGRLMGASLGLGSGVIRVGLTTRTVPPAAGDGITWDQVAVLAPTVTPDNLDDTVSIDTFAIVGASTV